MIMPIPECNCVGECVSHEIVITDDEVIAVLQKLDEDDADLVSAWLLINGHERMGHEVDPYATAGGEGDDDACPHCGARGDESCVSSNGRLRSDHAARRR